MAVATHPRLEDESDFVLIPVALPAARNTYPWGDGLERVSDGW